MCFQLGRAKEDIIIATLDSKLIIHLTDSITIKSGPSKIPISQKNDKNIPETHRERFKQCPYTQNEWTGYFKIVQLTKTVLVD